MNHNFFEVFLGLLYNFGHTFIFSGQLTLRDRAKRKIRLFA